MSQEQGAPALFVIPNSATHVFVWCSVGDGVTVTDVCVAGKPAPVVERKKLFRPGGNLELLFIEAAQLRDGVECEVHGVSPSQEPVVVQTVAHLAHWDNPDTARVLNLIASRFSHVTGTAQVLER